jgi:predicted PurR-regulated permease PerM
MQYNVLVGVVLFLLVFILAIQIQLSDLSRKMQENMKNIDAKQDSINKRLNDLLDDRIQEKNINTKVDGLLNERLQIQEKKVI